MKNTGVWKMVVIDTSKKGWQKQMEQCMREKKKFVIITKDKKLAESLAKNEIKVGALKLVLLGSTTVAGLSGVAYVAAASSIAALADPEPLSKTVLVILSAACAAAGAYFVYRLTKMLLYKEYRFKIKYKGNFGEFGGEIEIEAEPIKGVS